MIDILYAVIVIAICLSILPFIIKTSNFAEWNIYDYFQNKEAHGFQLMQN